MIFPLSEMEVVSRVWWNTPEIPVARKAEEGESQVQSQAQQLSETMSYLVRTCLKTENKTVCGCVSVVKHPGFNPWRGREGKREKMEVVSNIPLLQIIFSHSI